MTYFSKRLILIAFILINTTWLASASCEANLEVRAKDFIQGLGDQAIQILEQYENQKISREEKKQQLRKMILKSIDFERIGRSSLGVYKRRLSETSIKEFLTVFENAITRTYLQKFEEYNDDRFAVQRSSVGGNGKKQRIIVQSKLIRKNGPEVSLVWVVVEKDGQLVVIDLQVERASMLITYQQQYQSIISKGTTPEQGIKKLIQELQKNNATWEAA
jgi:ABC-type transporter MlaC component